MAIPPDSSFQGATFATAGLGLESGLACSLGQHLATVRALAYFPDGKTLASGSDDGSVKLWDLATRQERLTLRVPPPPDETSDILNSSIWSIAIAANGQALAAGDNDGRITVWRAGASRN